MDGKKVYIQKLPHDKCGRIVGVARERTIVGIPVIVVLLPDIDVPLLVVGVPVHVDREPSDSLCMRSHPCHYPLIRQLAASWSCIVFGT